MFLIRPVESGDLDDLTQLASRAGAGLTTLPRDPEVLEKKINRSMEGFGSLHEEPEGETYLFVLEDPSEEGILGTAAVVSKVGGFEPFYTYRIETEVHESEQLDVRVEIRTLNLVQEHDGPCEIGTLFLDPEVRARGLGRFLSLNRFVFMAHYPGRFDPTVIAELRGVLHEDGRCPLWEAIGRHFFEIDFATADHLSAADKRFIAELMPTHPIYIPLLPRSAREVIGRVHKRTRPAKAILESEGFSVTNMVDIFEGGPLVRCPREEIRTVRESRLLRVGEIGKVSEDNARYILARFEPAYRATLARISVNEEGQVRLPKPAAERLKLTRDDRVRTAPLHPSE